MDDPAQPLVFTATEARARGLTRHQVAHRVTRGTWTVWGVPIPEPQVDVLHARGRFVGRGDGLWDGATLGEADGRVKYLLRGPYLAAASPDAAADELVELAQRRLDAEKARRDALHDLGLEVVRWSFRELAGDPDGVVRRIQARRAAADAARFTGRFRRRPVDWTQPARFPSLPVLMGDATNCDGEASPRLCS